MPPEWAGRAGALKEARHEASSALPRDSRDHTRGCHGRIHRRRLRHPPFAGHRRAGPRAVRIHPRPNLTDAEWRHGSTDGDIFTNIRNGIGPDFEMKPNKILKDEEIWQIVNYIRSLGPSAAK